MSDKYILDGHTPVACDDLMQWGVWFENHENRRVAATEKDGIRVSTVFLGLNHNFDEGRPILFETMLFGGEHDEFQERCSTWGEAEDMHKRACDMAFKEPAK